jgi:hypothetical protein
MQMMFQKQHFGHLAMGFSNVDEWRIRHIKYLFEDSQHASDRERFYSVTSGGVHHPWEHKEYELRVAITADGMVCYEESSGQENVRIFAKVEHMGKEIYLAYVFPWQVISWGFPDPVKTAMEITELASRYVKEGIKEFVDARWIVVEKPQVPVYHRSLLGKVMARVNDAFTQGSDFFQNPKSK